MRSGREIRIGPLVPGEEPALHSLLERCALPDAGVRDHLANALVARQGKRLVGSAVLELYPDGALLRSVAVEESVRGEGIGLRLTAMALELARERGMRRVFLLTETAAEFFPRLGFRPIARSAVPASVRTSLEFMAACPESALVMERAL
jgi:amino-acid N-acetyltransferase